jgi:DNA-binding GntR family transcriptional regulator
MVLSQFTGLLHDIKHVNLSQMHHREVLQASIQQLNGEFYGAMLAAAGRQHAEEMTRSNRQHAQGVVPASWMRA